MSLGLVILLITMFTTEPLQFSIFPSLLLVTTLYRLSLNISSTRLILGDGAAGKVIDAFGQFVVGGNYVVGGIVFIIITVIQFVVITSGSGRVAEVAARFTLDAMPGKQMSIDADLNSGLITEDEARAKRERLQREADFFGAMDGASKFVRGDAIAGIVIILVNILGGFVIGVAQMGMPMGEALQRFTLLTIGDGWWVNSGSINFYCRGYFGYQGNLGGNLWPGCIKAIFKLSKGTSTGRVNFICNRTNSSHA
ncbi:hypothetical protein N752_22030 [Desulforamulus aquiferis]|nr:hypothetical protein N752_22030 [Desulforamulus aquiferis]